MRSRFLILFFIPILGILLTYPSIWPDLASSYELGLIVFLINIVIVALVYSFLIIAPVFLVVYVFSRESMTKVLILIILLLLYAFCLYRYNAYYIF